MSKCKCSFRAKTLGDGCRYCNPDYLISILEDNIEELETELENIKTKTCESCEYFKPNTKEDLFSGGCNLLTVGMDKDDGCIKGWRSKDD